MQNWLRVKGWGQTLGRGGCGGGKKSQNIIGDVGDG